MGLAWQQGPLATGSIGHFLTAQPMPARLLFVEPLRRRMRVRFADRWIAESEDVVLGQTVIAHGVDRGLDTDEILGRTPPDS